MSEAEIPNLPTYEAPKKKEPAVLPPALASATKPHAIFKGLLASRLAGKKPQLSSRKIFKPIGKKKKLKIV